MHVYTDCEEVSANEKVTNDAEYANQVIRLETMHVQAQQKYNLQIVKLFLRFC